MKSVCHRLILIVLVSESYIAPNNGSFSFSYLHCSYLTLSYHFHKRCEWCWPHWYRGESICWNQVPRSVRDPRGDSTSWGSSWSWRHYHGQRGVWWHYFDCVLNRYSICYYHIGDRANFGRRHMNFSREVGDDKVEVYGLIYRRKCFMTSFVIFSTRVTNIEIKRTNWYLTFPPFLSNTHGIFFNLLFSPFNPPMCRWCVSETLSVLNSLVCVTTASGTHLRWNLSWTV